MMGVILFAVCIARAESRTDMLAQAKAYATPFVIAFVLPLTLYAIWKYWYFGNLLPNSFYVKVAQTGDRLPGRGALLGSYEKLWYLFVLALIGWKELRRQTWIWPAIAWCVCLSIFYLFSHLWMNLYNRFTMSVEAILIVLAAAGFARVLLRLSPKVRWLSLVILIVFHVGWCLTVRGGWGLATRETSNEDAYRHVASILASIPHHESITLAWSDAGIVPYYSGLQSLDLVGLNTTSIARAHSADDVLRIIAHSKPDVLFVPLTSLSSNASVFTDKDHDRCRVVFPGGHGLIGSSFPRFLTDSAFSRYRPLATMLVSVYDVEILADTLSPHYADIQKIIAARIGKDPYVQLAPRCVVPDPGLSYWKALLHLN